MSLLGDAVTRLLGDAGETNESRMDTGLISELYGG